MKTSMIFGAAMALLAGIPTLALARPTERSEQAYFQSGVIGHHVRGSYYGGSLDSGYSSPYGTPGNGSPSKTNGGR